MAQIPAPKNETVGVVRMIIDGVIAGLGPTLIIAQIKIAMPYWNIPILSWILTWIVNKIAKPASLSLQIGVAKGIIRLQNDERKQEYDKTIADLNNEAEGASKDEHAKHLQAAKDAMYRLINRNK